MALSFSVEVFPIQNPQSKLVAFASLIIDDTVEVKNFRIVDGRNGLFVSDPQTKSNKQDENGKDIWYPDVKFLGDKVDDYSTAFQKEVYEAMLNAYRQKTAGSTRNAATEAQAASQSPVNSKSQGSNPLW